MSLCYKSITPRFLMLTLALGLAAAAGLFQLLPAHAQTTNTPTVTIATDQASVYEGGLAVFTLTRHGGNRRPITVQVKTWEPDHEDSSNQNETEQLHDVQFTQGSVIATLSVLSYIDTWRDVGDLELKAQVQSSTDGSYQVGSQDTATVEVVDLIGMEPPAGVTAIGLWSGQASVTEGWRDPLSFEVRRYGETSEPLSVDIMIEDPQEVLRGNHWDPPPLLPTQVEFAAGSTSETLLIPVPNDQRALSNAFFKVIVLPSTDYLIRKAGTGFELSERADVIDNDTAQELELNFGKDGVNDADVDEGDTLKFIVKRRQQDVGTGKTATFVLRVETNRSGADRLLEDWTENTSTGRLFKDYPLELTGSDTEVEQEIDVIENGSAESNWRYWASIKALEDFEGNTLTDAQEAEYWTVNQGFRETTVRATDSGASTGTVSLGIDQTDVYEGEWAVFTLTREGGPMDSAVRVRVQTDEPNRTIGFGNNPSYQIHNVTIEPWQSTATLVVAAYVDDVSETQDWMDISFLQVSSPYQFGNPNRGNVSIKDPPPGSAVIALSADKTAMAEGETATFTLTRTGGDTTQELAVDIEVDDSSEFLRGNHFDAAPDIPEQVVFSADSTSQTISLTAPDDQRDVTDGSFAVTVLPSSGYFPGNPGLLTTATVAVTDNDTAQELQFDWGWLSEELRYSSWEPGETYQTCDGLGSCTPGPAEGIFYYEDDRDFTFDYNLAECCPAHFRVTRRAEDVGKTATFVVRVEHNRGWVSLRHADWPIDPVTGNRYQEFPLTLTGNQRQLVGRIELRFNGRPDTKRWEYSAEIKQLEDVSDGAVLTADQEAEYWTVLESNQLRKQVILPDDPGWPAYTFDPPTPNPVSEGQEVTFTLNSIRGYILEPFTVQVLTWEPNRSAPDGTNPTEQVHTVTFPAVPMTPLYNNDSGRSEPFTVTATDDAEHEASDFLKAKLAANVKRYNGLVEIQVRIENDDHPTISLSVNSTSVTEGDTVTFTLTRGVNTAQELIVGVTVDDPGGFLQGNSVSEAVEVPSSVVFAPGDTTKEIALALPDDRRDIPDSAITFTVTQDPEFEMVGPASSTVQVADNDGPSVAISFEQGSYAVDEGDSVTVTVSLSPDPERRVPIPLTTTEQGGATSADYSVPASVVFNRGETEKSFTFTAVDDTVDDDDESVKIGFGNLPTGVTAGTTEETTVSITDDDVPSVTASFGATDYIAFEGYTVELTVTLSEDPERTVTIPLTTTDQGGATSSDYSGVPASVVFNSGETEKSFTFTAVDDTVGDDGETVKIGFGTLPTRVGAGSADETTVFIKDEVPSVTANFEQGSYGVVEGDSVSVAVRLSADPERTVTIPLTATEQGGATSADYSVPVSVVFNRGEMEKSFSFEADSDPDLDDGESVVIGFGALPEGIDAGSPSETVVSIDDNSRVTYLARVNPNGTVSDNTTVAGEFKVRIYFNPGGEGLLEEELEVTNGSIVDFRNIPRGTVNVWYVDILPELGAIAVTVRVPADVVEGGNQAAEVTYDAVPPLIATLTTSAVMPVIRKFVVTVTFDQDVTPLPGTAEGDVKWYFSPAEDLTISHGTYVGYEKITNRVYDVMIRPSMAVGTLVVALPERKVATGQITDVWNLATSIDVAAGKRSVTFEQATYSVGEGDDVVIRVILDEDPLNTVVIPITATGQGGAVVSGDYEALPSSVTFNSGETEKTFTFTAADDDLDDDDESVTIAIGNPLPEIILKGTTHETTVNIVDDDVVGVTVEHPEFTVEEGSSATYTVALDTQPTGDVTVTIDGVAGTDLALDKTTLTFTAQDWNTPQAVTVTARQDHDAVDDTATLTHEVSSANDTDYNGLSADVDVTVADDDTAGITVTPRVQHVTEGETAWFSVVLDTQPTADVTVTTTNGPTYVFTPQNWSTPWHLGFPTRRDTDTIDSGSFARIKAKGGDYDGLTERVMIYALDEDPVMRYSLQEVGPVNEDAGTVRVTVRAVTNEAGVPRIDYPVKVQSREDTALAGSDYQEVNETLWFAVDDFEEFENDSGQTRYRQTAYLDVRILEDISAEGTESFGLILNSLADYRWPAYGVRRIDVPIIDNDSSGVTVTPTELTVDEGDLDTYTVVLDTQPAGDVTVTIEGVAGTDPDAGQDHPHIHGTGLECAAGGYGDGGAGPRRRR